MPWVAPQPPDCFAALFALILSGLQKAMAAGAPKVGPDRDLSNATWHRISGVSARFVALVAAFREGRLRPLRPRGKRSSRQGEAAKKPFRFPSKFGWLLRFGSEVCCHRSLVEHWLTTNEEAMAFIAAEPRRAGRILRPLCHMLGIELAEALRPPKRTGPQRSGGGKGQRGRRRDGAEADTQPAEGGAAVASAASGVACSASAPLPGSPNVAPWNHRKPTKAEIRSWMPGQKRPLPWTANPVPDEPPRTRRKRRAVLQPA